MAFNYYSDFTCCIKNRLKIMYILLECSDDIQFLRSREGRGVPCWAPSVAMAQHFTPTLTKQCVGVCVFCLFVCVCLCLYSCVRVCVSHQIPPVTEGGVHVVGGHDGDSMKKGWTGEWSHGLHRRATADADGFDR